MRKLKFRIWDYCASSFVEEGRGQDIWDCSYDQEVCYQQYTGLKDKNEVEIYEGDIVKVYSEEFENENFTGKVIFDEGSFLTWINKNDIRGVWSGDDIEVIGNIMETPELLKQ